jgi:hypothetical protein
MAAVRETVRLCDVKPEVAAPLVDALAGRSQPAAVFLRSDETWWLPIRYVIAGLATLVVVIGMAVGAEDRHHHRDVVTQYVAVILYLWITLWAWAGPWRQAWRRRHLPWKPGIYALGPRVIDARSSRLRAFALTGVSAELDGVRNLAEPCLVRVTSLWKIFTLRIPERAAAVSVRDQIQAGRVIAPTSDRLEPTLDRSARIKAGSSEPAAVWREPLVFRHAWIATLLISGVVGAVAVYVRELL